MVKQTVGSTLLSLDASKVHRKPQEPRDPQRSFCANETGFTLVRVLLLQSRPL